MGQIKSRKVIRGLTRKDFIKLVDKKNDLWYAFTIDGEVVPQIKTFMSGGGKKGEIYEKNIQNMVRELHLDNKRQFFEYIECTYPNEAYIENLRRKGIIQ